MKDKVIFNTNNKKVIILIAAAIAAVIFYQFINVDMKHFDFAMKFRGPKLLVMLIAAFCIGSASIVFQSIINNTIVTPCLLGMNSLYVLLHTAIIFILGTSHILVVNRLASFTLDMAAMGIAAMLIYGVLFKKTGGNVLYILLAGSVLATLFGSITTTLQRVMSPNDYETLQNSTIASFHRVNSDIMLISIICIVLIIVLLRKELALIDVITLGRAQAVNLGVDYEKTINRLLIGVTLFIAIATALVGPISFLGLVIANLGRQLFKTYKHSYLCVGTALIGMIILLAGQTLIEQVFNFSANIGSFINVLGGIYFLYLILRNRR